MSYDPAFQQRIYEMLMASQSWSDEEMRDFQEQQLSQLLRFARDSVPFYKSRLEKVLDAEGKINWDRWAEVPILTRDDLVTHREDLLAPHLPPGHGNVEDHRGSGTTGKPVTSRHNSLTALVSTAGLFRAFEWYGLRYGSVFCNIEGDDPKIGAWPEGADNGPWGPEWAEARDKGTMWHINHLASSDQIADFLQRKSVSYFSGRPSRVHGVALAAERLGITHPIKACIVLGENISDAMRQDCKRIWGADVFNLYASKEVYNIGHQCPSGPQLHVNDEMLLFEVLDGQNRPCKPGERGRAIVTSFFNTSQPFIRYDIGDQVIMAKRCACGRTLATIDSVVGRTTHMLRFPGDRVVGMTLPSNLLQLLGAKGWQIAQVKPLEIEVRYIPVGQGAVQDFAAITHEVITRTDPRVSVRFKEISELPLTPSGKFIEIVCELPSA